MQPEDKTITKENIGILRNWIRIIRYGFLYIFLFTINTPYLSAQNTSILILKHANNNFTTEVISNIKTKINEKYTNITIDKKNIADKPNHEQFSKYNFIITLGNKSAEYALNTNTTNPVLSLLITKKATGLLRDTYAPTHVWSTISLDQPIKRQLLLIKHLPGKNKTIGTIFGPHSKKQQKNIIKTAGNLGLKLTYENVTITDQLISSIKHLTSKSDFMLAIPDPVTFNRKTIRGILLLTYRKGIPVIGFSQSYVKAGTLASAHSTPNQIGRQATEIIDSFITKKNLESLNFDPKYFSIAINKQVARTLGIKKINIDKTIKLIKHDENLK